MPRVSVLMPMRDTARYVGEAVASVLVQDFRDLELVVVDDGSTDRSRAAVEEMPDSRVRVLAGPTRGMAAAWNVALHGSSGEIVMQCDSDDAYPPGRIREQVGFLDARPEFGAVCGGFSTMDESGRRVSDLLKPGEIAEEITAELLGGRTRTSFCTFAIRRELLEAIGGRREFFQSGSDIDMQLRLAEVCRVWYQPVLRYHWRLHGRSLTHSQPSARLAFFDLYAREMRAQRVARGMDDLQLGTPHEPPPRRSPVNPAGRHVQGMLLGKAWRSHASGAKLHALAIGLRAIAHAPTNASAWRSVAALLLKPTRPSGS